MVCSCKYCNPGDSTRFAITLFDYVTSGSNVNITIDVKNQNLPQDDTVSNLAFCIFKNNICEFVKYSNEMGGVPGIGQTNRYTFSVSSTILPGGTTAEMSFSFYDEYNHSWLCGDRKTMTISGGDGNGGGGEGFVKINSVIASPNPASSGSTVTVTVNMTNTGSTDWAWVLAKVNGVLKLTKGYNNNNSQLGAGQTWIESFTFTKGSTDDVISVISQHMVVDNYVNDETRSLTVTTTGGGSNVIIVLSPNGGETWNIGTRHLITWTKSGTTGNTVKIELYKGSLLKKTIISSTGNDGSFTDGNQGGWLVPSDVGTGSDYKIKVTSNDYPTIGDISNNNFTIGTGTVIRKYSCQGTSCIPNDSCTGTNCYTNDPNCNGQCTTTQKYYTCDNNVCTEHYGIGTSNCTYGVPCGTSSSCSGVKIGSSCIPAEYMVGILFIAAYFLTKK